MSTTPVARRMHELLEPVHLVAYFADEADAELTALGMRNYWDGYFASRAGVLGSGAPAEVIDAIFYNFGPGEVARHIPWVWGATTPAAAVAAKERGCAASLHRLLGDLATTPELRRAGDLALRAATASSWHGRPIYAGYRTLPLPEEPAARLWHAATLLREHRGDGHTAVLVGEGIGGIEAHMLAGADLGLPPEQFGRIHHLPAAFLAEVRSGLVDRGILDADGGFTAAGRSTKDRIEARTDALAEPPYAALTDADRTELAELMIPISTALHAAGIPSV